MLLAALRDLQWRRRRFLITVIGTALVFAMSLLMSGLGNSFTVEVERTLDDQQARSWIGSAGVAGAFSPGGRLAADEVEAITAAVGEPRVAPLVYGTSTFRQADAGPGATVLNVNVFGVRSGQVGAPTEVVAGTSEFTDGQVVVPRILDVGVGERLDLAGTSFEVVGVVDKASFIAGTPTVAMTIEDAQRLLFGGQPLVSMLLSPLAPGELAGLPAGFKAFDRSEVTEDLMRPLQNPVQSINFVKVLLWMVAALIVASVVYLTVLERTRDIAVFKATGAGTGAIGMGITLQAVILAVVASLAGIAIALALAPGFPMDVAIARSSLVTLPVLAIVVGVIAGMFGVRRTAAVEPVTAFGGP